MGQQLTPITGPVKWVHTYMNMYVANCLDCDDRGAVLMAYAWFVLLWWTHRSFRSFTLPNGTSVQTCPPAMGYSFAGGTTYVFY